MSRTYTITLPLVAVLVAAILAVVYACSQVSFVSSDDLSIAVTTDTSEVELGRAFPLTVVRTWGNSIHAQPFDDRALAPLVTRLESTSLREHGAHVEETRNYLGYAFSLDPLVIPPVSFEGRYGLLDDIRETARSAPLRLRVKTTLDPKSPGVPEGPGAPLDVPWLGQPYVVGAAVLVALALVALARRRSARRTRVPPPPPAPVGPGPEVAALADLARLRSRLGEPGADVVEAGDVVRAYAANRFAVRAGEMTTHELQAALVLASDAHAALRGVLDAGDLVKFADHAPSDDERDRVLDAAAAFVRGTAKDAP